MSVLAWIFAASFAGGALSVLAAAAFALTARSAWITHLISYAIGALLGAAFLEVLPHAIEAQGEAGTTTAIVLAGILGFFVLEKLVLWRHCHDDHCEGHEAHAARDDHGRSGLLILVGDTFHNFVDGVLIAAAFMQDVRLGIVTALAIIAHEIPQEVGDFLILLHSGYSRLKALAFNLPLAERNLPMKWLPAVLITAADALSAARPGARRETLETYIKRLQKLEEIANSFEGVEKSYAIQAGREIRVMVKPENVRDDEMILKAREICKKIEDELDYPGQIKVHIIRETRVTEFAR